ncbi:hypothetical protein, partial [Klebsiella pneumoniae]
FDVNMSVPVASLISGLVMVVSAMYGIKVLRVLSYVAVPLLVVLCVYGLIEALNGDTMQLIADYRPEQNMGFMDGLAVTIGSFALGAVIAGDYSQ